MMQQIAPGPYQTAHYAISTGFMALTMMITGMVSGVLQEAYGYQGFFVLICVATIPSFIITWFAPFPVDLDDAKDSPDLTAQQSS
jgi:PAT family beta-lactamase induction signal transducer AmpG